MFLLRCILGCSTQTSLVNLLVGVGVLLMMMVGMTVAVVKTPMALNTQRKTRERTITRTLAMLLPFL